MAYVTSIHTAHTPSPVHSFYSYPTVLAPQIFTYGKIDPPSPSHESSAQIMTPNGNPMPHNNPHNPVPNVPADLDADTIFSYSSLSDSSDSSDDKYYK